MMSRYRTSKASQSSQRSSTVTYDEIFPQIDPTNFAEKIKTEADAVQLATSLGLLPERGLDDDVKCVCGGIFQPKTVNRTPLG